MTDSNRYIEYAAYLHSSKDSNYDLAEELGLDDLAAREFAYSNYEVKLNMRVDTSTGKTEIIGVNDRML